MLTPRHAVDLTAIRRDIERQLTRLRWLWVLGEVWLALLVAGAVVSRLWTR